MAYDVNASVPERLRALAKMVCPHYFDGYDGHEDDRCIGCYLDGIASELERERSRFARDRKIQQAIA